MIGIVIITHEAVGEAYRSLAQHFFPAPLPNIRLLGVQPTEDHDSIIRRTRELAGSMENTDKFLVLTDIFGATPCNAARKLVVPGKVAILTGLNAPMMVKAIQYSPQADDLTAFTEAVRQAAVNGIMAITEPPEEKR